MNRSVAMVAVATLLGGVALAQDRFPQQPLKARLERVEQALARFEQKASDRAGGMMEGCREMMGGAMMGDGTMGGARRSLPNEQWRNKD